MNPFRSPLVALILMALGCTVLAEDLQTIRLELAREQVERVELYLVQNPEAKDKLDAVNLLLNGYQTQADFENMVKWLEVRYDLLMPEKLHGISPETLNQLVNRTAMPLLEFYYRLFQYDKAEALMQQIRNDFKGTPVFNQIQPVMLKIAARYRMPADGDRPSASFSDFLTGENISLEDYKGSYVLMEFWVTNCDICKKQKIFMQEAYSKYQEQGFQILAFSQDPDESILRRYLEANPEPWPQCFDQAPAHRVASALKVRVVPYNMIVDPEGKVVAVNVREQALLDFLAKAYGGTKESDKD